MSAHHLHHHIKTIHSKPLAKLLTIVSVLLFLFGGYTGSFLSNQQQRSSLVAQVPENFPAGTAFVCSDRCSSNTDGTSKFCYNECTKTGHSQPVFCSSAGFDTGSEQKDSECDDYATCTGTGFTCAANGDECSKTLKGTTEAGFSCSGSQICCKLPTDDPAKRQLVCNDSCKTGSKGEKNFCYRECHPNKEGYKHDVLCQNDGSGGVKWILENEVADSACHATNVTPPPNGEGTATPPPGGGPTATPKPGGGTNACTGDNFFCTANGNECTAQVGGKVEVGKTCNGSQVCCNITSVCAGTGFQCAANGNECTNQLGGETAAGKKCSGTQVCCNVKPTCTGTGLQCAANGNECTQQIGGTVESGKRCSGTQVCCNKQPAQQQASGSCFHMKTEVIKESASVCKVKVIAINDKDNKSYVGFNIQKNNEAGIAQGTLMFPGTKNEERSYTFPQTFAPGNDVSINGVMSGSADTSCNDVIETTQIAIGANCTAETYQGTGGTEVTNTCEPTWTCTKDTLEGCPAHIGTAPGTCPGTDKPVCCKIVNETNVKVQDCRDKQGFHFGRGDICYKCYGRIVEERRGSGVYAYGKEESNKAYCVANMKCKDKIAGVIKEGLTCYNCYGRVSGGNFGIPITCTEEGEQAISGQSDKNTILSKLVNNVCPENPKQCEKWVEDWLPWLFIDTSLIQTEDL